MRTLRLDRIYRGRCEDALANTRRFPDECADLIMTSPPYADRRDSSYGGVRASEYVDWFLPIANQLQRVLKPRGSFVLNIKENAEKGERQTYVIELILALRKEGWFWIEEYCWFKKNCYPGKWHNRFRDSWERCIHFTKQKRFNMYQDAVKVPIGEWSKTRFTSMTEKDFVRIASGTNQNFGRRLSNWLRKRKVYPHNVVLFEKEHYTEPSTLIALATECQNRNHAAPFPIELPSWFIRLFTKQGDVVFDPFIGVGTTAVACVLLDRRFLGIEKSKDYVEEAKKNVARVKRLKSNN